MMRFAMGFAKFAFTFLFFAVFGIAAIIGSVLLFVALPAVREVRDRNLLKQDWSVPTYQGGRA